MRKFSLRKTAAFIFFIIIVGLSLIIFDQTDYDISDRNTVLIFGGIFFSALFLLILNFINPVKKIKHVYKGVKTEIEEEKTKDETTVLTGQTENYTAKILANLSSEKDIQSYSQKLLGNFASCFRIVQGIFYLKETTGDIFKSTAFYAFYSEKDRVEFTLGEGLSGQTALDKELKIINDLSEGYITVVSGLGSSSPKNLLIIPFVKNNKTIALLELAAFEEFPKNVSGIYQGIHNIITENIIKLQ